jgi:hypothetical protein
MAVVRNEPAVLKYGRKMLEDYNLATARKEFNSGITYCEDFIGGLLVLADNTTIKPRAGWGYMLDSREAHMVTPILSGHRFVTVVKIY